MSAPAKSRRRPVTWRLGWMLPAGLALLAGLDAGLLLLGLPAPVTTDRLPVVHGMLMVMGFVGTLISLERATALGRWYGYLAPLLLGLAAIALVADPVPLILGKALLVAGAAAFTLVYLPLWRRQYDEAILTQLLAAGLSLAAAIRWAGGAGVDQVLPWLIGFVVLTIAAERVDLARITLGARAGMRVLLHGLSIVAALAVSVFLPSLGAVLLGIALLLLVAWLIPHDVARRTIRSTGATRYMAVAILCGYGWLTAAGLVLLAGTPRGSGYDAVVHAVFLGYTISMIMAHATTILPAVLRIDLPYRRAFWAPLVLLQASLVARLWMGDALGWDPAWKIGGALGVIALLLFLATAVTSAILGPVRQHPRVPESMVSGAAPDRMITGRRAGAAVAAVLLATTALVAVGTVRPLALQGGMGAAPGDVGVQPAAHTDAQSTAGDAPVQTVSVAAADLRFTPSRIEVPAGTRLIIELTNTDAAMTHDLVVATGARTSRLAPGESETIDVGVITGDLDAWCEVAGHRQQGMVLDIVATGALAGAVASSDTPGSHGHRTVDEVNKPPLDLAAAPGPGFEPRDASLPPLPAAGGPVTHRVALGATEQEMEVAPGVTQRLWTFGGSAPGPVLHGRVGDTFEITLRNDGAMGHSIDFHAGFYAPDEPMRTIAPGESLSFRFTAERAGIWMYHCGTAPASTHIASGMYGAVVIEPPDLPRVDRSYVLVQGEYYLGEQGGELDAAALAAGEPDLVVFNGYANQYDHAPLQAEVGERVRIWVLDAGPERPSAFHVIGGQFDTVWSEGGYLVDRAEDTGSQALGLMPAQGGFVELVPPEAGHYPIISHVMIDAERGAHGILEVTAP